MGFARFELHLGICHKTNGVHTSRTPSDTTRCVDFAASLETAFTGMLSIGPPLLTLSDFRHPLIFATVLQFAGLSSSRISSLSRSSQLML
jgi:hypothetical protein